MGQIFARTLSKASLELPDRSTARILSPTLLRILFATAMLFASMAIVPPSTDALIRESFGLDQQAVSLYFTYHSLPQLLLVGLLAGWLSDRWRTRLPIALVGGVLTGVTTILQPWMPTYNSLLVLRFFDGLFGIVAIGMLMTKAIDLTASGSKSMPLAIFFTAIPAGYLLGSFLVAFIGNSDVALSFSIVGGLTILASLALLKDCFQRESIQESQPSAREIFGVFKTAPQLWFPIFFGAVDKFTFGFLVVLASLALKDLYNVTPELWGGSALGLLWVGYLIGCYPTGILSKKLGPWTTVALGSAGYGVCLLFLVALGSPYLFIAITALAGIFIAFQTMPTYALVGKLSGGTSTATAMGAFNLFGSLAMITGFIAAGALAKNFDYFTAFAVAGAFELLAAIMALRIGRWTSPNAGVASSSSMEEASHPVPPPTQTQLIVQQ